jgi:threonine synthase
VGRFPLFLAVKFFVTEKRVIINAATITSNAAITKYKNSIFKPTIKVIIFQTGHFKVTYILPQTLFLTCGHITQLAVEYTY